MTEIVSAQTFSQRTIVIPAISVSEAYDSNVFYTPKSSLRPDQKPEDFITYITPQINVAHADQYIKGSLSAAGLITKYVNNPELDYTGVNTAGQFDLKGLANTVSQRIAALSVRGTYQYTPTTNGFGTVPVGSGVGTNFGSTQFNALNAGQITNRASMHIYTLGVTGSYLLTPTTTLTPMYTYTRLSFGNQSGGQNNALFDTTGNSGSATLTTLLTPRDTVGTTASISSYSQSQSTSSGTGTFTTAYATVNWARGWTQEWSSSLAGGGNVIFPQDSVSNGQSTGQSTKTTVGPQATAAISYTSFSEALRGAGSSLGPSDDAPSTGGPFATLPSLVGSLPAGGIMSPGRYTASLRYTFSVFPAYAGGAGALRAHVVGINASGGITSKLTGQVGLNYAHGSTGSVLSYDTVGLTAGLRYLIGPVLASLTANYLNFLSSEPTATSNVTAFSKEIVMLTLSTAFNSQSFFRMDGFGSWGTPSSGEGTPVPSGAEPGGGSSGAEPRN